MRIGIPELSSAKLEQISIPTKGVEQKSKSIEEKKVAADATTTVRPGPLTRAQKGYIDAVIQGCIIGIDTKSSESPYSQLEKQINGIIQALNKLQNEGDDYRVLSVMFNKPSVGLKGIESTTGSKIQVSLIKQYLLDLVNNEIHTVINQTIPDSAQQKSLLENWETLYKEKSEQIKSEDPILFKSAHETVLNASTIIEDAKLEGKKRYLQLDIVEEKLKIIKLDEKSRQEIEEQTDQKIEYAVIRPAVYTTKEPPVEFKILTPTSLALLAGKEIKSTDMFAAQRFYETTLQHFYFDLIKNIEKLCSDKIYTVRVTQTKPGEPFRFTINFPPLLENGSDKPGTILSITSPILSRENLEVFFRSKIEAMEYELPSLSGPFKVSQFHESFVRIAKYFCSQIKEEEITPPLKKLMLNKYFYRLFENKKLHLMDFVGINLEHVNFLINAAPQVNNLIESGIIISKDVKTLTQQQISNYSRLLKLFENEIKANTISPQLLGYFHEQDADALLQIKLHAFEEMKHNLESQTGIHDKARDQITDLESKCATELKQNLAENLEAIIKNKLDQIFKSAPLLEAMEQVKFQIRLRSDEIEVLDRKRSDEKSSSCIQEIISTYDKQIEVLGILIPSDDSFYQRFVKLLVDRIQSEYREEKISKLDDAAIKEILLKEINRMLETCEQFSFLEKALEYQLNYIAHLEKSKQSNEIEIIKCTRRTYLNRDPMSQQEEPNSLIEYIQRIEKLKRSDEEKITQCLTRIGSIRHQMSLLADDKIYETFLKAIKTELNYFHLSDADKIELQRPRIESDLSLCTQIHDLLKQQRETKHSPSEVTTLSALIEQPENSFNNILLAAIAVRKIGEKLSDGIKDFPLSDLEVNKPGLLKLIQEKILTKELIENLEPKQLRDIVIGAEKIKDRSPAIKALFIQGALSVDEILKIPPTSPDSFESYEKLPKTLLDFKLESKEAQIQSEKELKVNVLNASRGSHQDILKSNVLNLANNSIIDEIDFVSIFNEPRVLTLLKKLPMNSACAHQLQQSIVEQLCCDSISRRLDTLSDLNKLAKSCHAVGLKSIADLIEKKQAVVAIFNALEACVQVQDIWGDADFESKSDSGSHSSSNWDSDQDPDSIDTSTDSISASTTYHEGSENYKQFASRISSMECDIPELREALIAILAETEKETAPVAKPKPRNGSTALFAPRREPNELQKWGKLFERLMAKATDLRNTLNLEKDDPRLAILDAALSQVKMKERSSGHTSPH